MVARGRSNTTAAPGPCNIPGGRDACNQGRCLPITDAYPAGGRKLLRCQGWGPAAHTLRSKAVRPCGPGPCSSRLSLGEFQKPAATHASLRTEGSREALVLLQLWQACAVLKCVEPAFKNRGRSHWCLEMAGLTALGRGPCGSMGGWGEGGSAASCCWGLRVPSSTTSHLPCHRSRLALGHLFVHCAPLSGEPEGQCG